LPSPGRTADDIDSRQHHGVEYTVIVFQRQHFDNNPGSFDDIEPDVPFAGAATETQIVEKRSGS
jgi:hypothetical protein